MRFLKLGGFWLTPEQIAEGADETAGMRADEYDELDDIKFDDESDDEYDNDMFEDLEKMVPHLDQKSDEKQRNTNSLHIP